jgi:hypothetical protein
VLKNCTDRPIGLRSAEKGGVGKGLPCLVIIFVLTLLTKLVYIRASV